MAEEKELNIIVRDEKGNTLGENGEIIGGKKPYVKPKKVIVCTDFSYRYRKRGKYRTQKVIAEERRARHPEWGGKRENSGRPRKWEEKSATLSVSVPSSTRERFYKIKETGMDVAAEIIEMIDDIATALGID